MTLNTLTIATPASIAFELANAPEIWWPRVRRDGEGTRWYEPLLVDDQCEAWLLGWPVGEGIELHDHGDSHGALVVVEGILRETWLEASDRMRHLRHRELGAGDVVEFGPDHIHDVVNGGDRQALSIHVYSPRLTSMTFYENRPGRGLTAVRTETSSPDVVLAAA